MICKKSNKRGACALKWLLAKRRTVKKISSDSERAQLSQSDGKVQARGENYSPNGFTFAPSCRSQADASEAISQPPKIDIPEVEGNRAARSEREISTLNTGIDSQKTELFPIMIRMFDGRAMTVDVSGQDTVSLLNQKVEERWGIVARLVFAGKPLIQAKTLKDCMIAYVQF